MKQKLRKKILLISLLLFPFVYYYLSPYLIIDGAMQGIITGSFIFFILLFISSLFFGRFFCGWLCPAGRLQDCTSKQAKKADWLKYLIWVPWVSIIIYLFITNGIKSIQPFYQTFYGISISNIYSVILFLLIAGFILCVALLFGKRSFCHNLCWMAPFMVIGKKISSKLKLPSIKLKADKNLCIDCKACNKNCPMGLDVNSMVKTDMENSECILCFNCVDVCPKKAIKV